MRIQVKGGTRSSSQDTLCETCKHGTVVQGIGSKQRIVHCGELGQRITFNVESCKAYRKFGELSLYELKEMGMVIELKGNVVGFFTPDKWRQKHGDVLPRIYEGGYDD